MEVFLYNSTVCRLCGEENDNGTFLYSSEENNQNLSETINSYLPIKVSDDGHLPRTICPGCTIQLEATVEFLNLIINGQKVLRKLFHREKEYKRSIAKGAHESGDGSDFIYKLDTSDGVFTAEHPASLRIAGLEKPKRKRGRPPKSTKSLEEPQHQKQVQFKEENEQQNENEPSGKRRRKTPTRYKEAVQGSELERILIEEGVIEDDEKAAKDTSKAVKVPNISNEPEVIGHLECSGDPIPITKGKSRGRPKGPSRQKNEVCPICDLKFTSLGRYMSHVARHGPVQYKCDCDTLFRTRQSFCDHQQKTGHTGRTVVPIIHQEDEVEIEAEGVDIPLDIKETVTQDISESSANQIITDSAERLPENLQELVKSPVKCENEPDSEVVQLPEEDIDVEGDYVITTSEENNDVTIELTAERTEEEKEKKRKQSKLKCHFCPKMYNSKQSRALHIKAVHMGERGHACGECGARFGYPRSLALHRLSHRRVRTRGYACDLCGKVLNHPSSVVYHKQTEHATQRYVCGSCGKCFRHKQLLQRHQLVHSEERPYACRLCTARFKTKPNLLNHQLLHTGVKKFSCEICSTKFAHKTSLTLHMRWHSGLKPFVCGVCGKSFSQKGNLSEHERIHTGEKPFVCPMCSRRFTTSSQHRLHLRRHAAAHEHHGLDVRIHVEHPEQEVVIESPKKQRDSNKAKKPVSLLAHDARPDVDGADGADEQVIYVAYESEEGVPSFRLIEEQSVEIEPKEENVELYSGSSLLQPQLQTIEVEHETVQLENHLTLEGGQLEMQRIEIESGQVMQHEQLAFENVQLELETEGLVLEEHVEKEEMDNHVDIHDGVAQGLQLTMQDGTTLALASVEGGALQVITHDGQTIPVEINGYNEQEASQHSENILHHLNVLKSEDSDTVTYFISNVP